MICEFFAHLLFIDSITIYYSLRRRRPPFSTGTIKSARKVLEQNRTHSDGKCADKSDTLYVITCLLLYRFLESRGGFRGGGGGGGGGPGGPDPPFPI